MMASFISFKKTKDPPKNIPISEPQGFQRMELKIDMNSSGKPLLLVLDKDKSPRSNIKDQDLMSSRKDTGTDLMKSMKNTPKQDESAFILCIRFPDGYPFETRTVQLDQSEISNYYFIIF